MIVVCITGGIGSGKSLVCEVFSMLRVPVYSADDESRYISQSDPEIQNALIALLGDEIYQNGILNRSLMAEKIFKDAALLGKVNNIIHPKVAANFRLWLTKNSSNPYVIQESAILFESKAYLKCDKKVTVFSPKAMRISRVMQRKNMSMEKIEAIMHHQLPEEDKMLLSDHIIVNDESKLLIPQILHLHQVFLQEHSAS